MRYVFDPTRAVNKPRQTSAETQLAYTAVVMAGSRPGGDPLARELQLSHKCLIDIAGKTMLERIVGTLEACPHIAKIVLCIDAGFQNPKFIARRIDTGQIERLEAAGSPAASAGLACARYADEMPLLIVTADHPLLDLAMLDHFCRNAFGLADVAVGVARSTLVLARYPDATRTLLRFNDGPYCGCNLFVLNTPAASAATNFWLSLEHSRKSPWRLVRMLGIAPLSRYITGRLSLGEALAVISKKLDISTSFVEMPFAEAAIDVDKSADLKLVRSIVERA